MIPPNLPGLVNAINPKIDVGDAMYPYRISWLTGVRISVSKESGSNRLTNFPVLWFGSYLHRVLSDLASEGDHDQREHPRR